MLFDELGMPKTKRIKTGYTTDADALADLYAATEHPFLGALLRHRDASRLQPDGRGPDQERLGRRPDPHDVQPDHRRDRAARSTDPNLQNIPIRTDEGRRIREAFVVGAGLRAS